MTYEKIWSRVGQKATKRVRFLSYVVAVLSVALVLGITLSLGSLIRATPAQLFLVGVMVSAWCGGMGPGLLATALSALAVNYVLLEPHYALTMKNPGIGVQLATLIVSGLVITQLNESRWLVVRREQRLRAVSEAAQSEAQAVKERLTAETTLQQKTQVFLQRHAARQRLLTTIAQDIRRPQYGLPRTAYAHVQH